MRKSHLSSPKQYKLIKLLVAARTATALVNINKTVTAYYFHPLHLLIYQNNPHVEMFEAKADESYFGGERKGKWGPGANCKIQAS